MNSTGSEIKIKYKGLHSVYAYYNNVDSITFISPGNTKTIFVLINDGFVRNPEVREKLEYIDTLYIYQNDTLMSTKDFTQTKYWVYSAENDRANLKLIVREEDFR